jgi:Transposase DDE domain
MSEGKSSKSYEEIQNLLIRYAQESNEWAHFSERDSKLDAAQFVQAVVLGWLKKKDASLNELAHAAEDLGISISGAGLHDRMDAAGVMLLAGVLDLALKRMRQASSLPIQALECFQGIYITDSSQVALPAALVDLFRGNQSNSMLKLQVTWDYLHGNLAAVEIEEGRSCDQRCRLHVSHAQANTLQLFDLGYFKQEYLVEIDRQAAYFVTRYQSQTAVYEPEDGCAFDVSDWLKGMVGDEAERTVLLGGRVKLPVRFVVRRLAAKAAAARRRKAKLKAQQQGKRCSSAYLFLLGWDILVTNLSSESWAIGQIFELYPLRFQIEWLFRIWKDQLGVDELGDWRIERVMCQLYAHLLGVILCHGLSAAWRWGEWEYSFFKIVQVIQAAVPGLMRCLARAGWGFAAWLRRLQEDFRRFGRKTKRRKSPSTLQIIYNWGLS